MTIKLIVGLANPGAEYAATRHNAGAAWDLLADRHRAPLREESKFFGYTSRINLATRTSACWSPLPFQRTSAVKPWPRWRPFIASTRMKFWSPMTSWIYRPGVAKFKLGGGHGGHNGLKDIISKLGNNPNFHRLRVGIGHPGDKTRLSALCLANHRPASRN